MTVVTDEVNEWNIRQYYPDSLHYLLDKNRDDELINPNTLPEELVVFRTIDTWQDTQSWLPPDVPRLQDNRRIPPERLDTARPCKHYRRGLCTQVGCTSAHHEQYQDVGRNKKIDWNKVGAEGFFGPGMLSNTPNGSVVTA